MDFWRNLMDHDLPWQRFRKLRRTSRVFPSDLHEAWKNMNCQGTPRDCQLQWVRSSLSQVLHWNQFQAFLVPPCFSVFWILWNREISYCIFSILEFWKCDSFPSKRWRCEAKAILAKRPSIWHRSTRMLEITKWNIYIDDPKVTQSPPVPINNHKYMSTHVNTVPGFSWCTGRSSQTLPKVLSITMNWIDCKPIPVPTAVSLFSWSNLSFNRLYAGHFGQHMPLSVVGKTWCHKQQTDWKTLKFMAPLRTIKTDLHHCQMLNLV